MNVRIKRTLFTFAVAAGAVLSLAGCGATGTADEPQKVGDSDYSVDYIQTENGETVACYWYNKGTRTGSMSCDFDHPVTNR